ncbi:Gfo/Idh/MocA family protein [Parasegetibacter sp. NRK P23]|uniref:Gfo/Idh/MocA family protein n=1 Tax=Parasegetibacter sp. NRK P23 TaxID=2942999 RepID=UPI0020431CF0|nr:Gfo/Idh/MocA family oxidoreductase [Parasegetibacter sp. NRK P23]MCM5526866.1 Gfo/Idh/MocA family oxidoreductase [Parasegetibacter sp. NRK P23]
MSNTFFFAIIGCGRISRRHTAAMQLTGTVSAVCDNDFAAAEKLAEETGAKAYTAVDEMLAAHPEVQLVAICSPNGYHAEHTIKSLQAGKHVLCEKPLCIDSRAGWQMLETARLCNRHLWVVKAARYFPAVIALKQAISEGKMGKLLSFQLNCTWNRPVSYFENTWRGKLFPDGGILYTQFSHYIDALYWLAGKPVLASGFRTNTLHKGVIETEDTGVAVLQMENGAIGNIHWTVNGTNKNMEISMLLVGEEATVKLGGNNMQELVFQQWNDPSCQISPSDMPASVHTKMYEEIGDILRGATARSITNGMEALACVEIISLIYEHCTLKN